MSEITCTYDGTAAVLTVANEPKLNALTMGMLHQLEDHLVAIERNNDVRAVILTGAGPKAFCCGADIAEWGPLSGCIAECVVGCITGCIARGNGYWLVSCSLLYCRF